MYAVDLCNGNFLDSPLIGSLLFKETLLAVKQRVKLMKQQAQCVVCSSVFLCVKLVSVLSVLWNIDSVTPVLCLVVALHLAFNNCYSF